MKPNFAKNEGLVPVIVQEKSSGVVLMLAYMNERAWEETLQTGKAVYWSRSRGKLWRKGEESGNVQLVEEVLLDCDEDTVLLKVEQIGRAACHTGYISCFYRRLHGDKIEIVSEKVFNPEEVYNK